MDAFETLDQANDELYDLLGKVRNILDRPLSARGRKLLTEAIDRRLSNFLAEGSTYSKAHALRNEEQRAFSTQSAQVSTPPAQSARWPAPTPVLYARPADVLAAQHRETAPGLCSACGTRASGQQLGGARKNHKPSIKCKCCGAQVAI